VQSVDLTYFKRKPRIVAFADQQTLGGVRLPRLWSFGSVVYSQDDPERDTEQQISTNIYQTTQDSALVTRQCTHRGSAAYFLQYAGGQTKPFRPDTENNDRLRAKLDYGLNRGDLSGRLAEGLLRHFSI